MSAEVASMETNSNCFVVSPIGDEGSPQRRRADNVFDYVIQPAATACGLTLVRADKIDESGNITSQVIDHLLTDPMVVADFWGNNPNVFYELALRHAIRLPVIHLYQEPIPFDVHQMRAIKLDHQDLHSADEARKAVQAQMEVALAPGFEQWTPVGVALDLDKLQASGSVVEQRIAEMYSMLERLDRRIASLLGAQLLAERPRTRGLLVDNDVTDILGLRSPLERSLGLTREDLDNIRRSLFVDEEPREATADS